MKLCRTHDMSTVTFLYMTHKKLETENKQLKKIYTEEQLKAEVVKETMEKMRQHAPMSHVDFVYQSRFTFLLDRPKKITYISAFFSSEPYLPPSIDETIAY